jgi:hypothetical protein
VFFGIYEYSENYLPPPDYADQERFIFSDEPPLCCGISHPNRHMRHTVAPSQEHNDTSTYGLNNDLVVAVVERVVLVDAGAVSVENVWTLSGKFRPRISHSSIVAL